MEKGLENLSKTALIALLERSQATIKQHVKNEVELQTKNNDLQAENSSIQAKNNDLQTENSNIQTRNNRLLIEKANLQQEKTYLEAQIAEYKRLLYGQKRERFIANPEQLSLPFEAPAEVVEVQQKAIAQKQEIARKRYKKAHPGRAKLPDHLSVEEIEIYPEGDLSEMVCIGKEVTYELECVPARFFIKCYIRYKYAPKSKEGKHLIAPLPERVINKGIPGAGLLTLIQVQKYVDHLPLYRQQEQFKREGIKVTPSTLNNWTRCPQEMLVPLYELMVSQIKNRGYLQADETTIKVLDSNKKGMTHQGYYWVYQDPVERMVLFDYQPGRGYEATEDMLSDFKGYLQSDGYSVYAKVAKKEQVTHVGCWAHVRREFKKAENNDKARAHKALTYIQQLYAIEAQAREKQMTPQKRKELRLEKSLPVINQMGKWIAEEYQKVLPKSAIGQALAYCANRWTALSNYMLDGVLEIDNNLTENAIRPVALGRKNYLFAGSHEAAQRSAMMYTFFANCKIHQVNPYNWLKYVLENINHTSIQDLHKFYPQNFTKNQPKDQQ